jgi:anti-sigma B factor antagonist
MEREKVDGVIIVTPKDGHLDASNRDEFRRSLESIVREAASAGDLDLVLDLASVRFVDSSGLGVIMTTLRHFRETGGEMVACNIMKQVKVLFDLVRLDRVMRVFADRNAAVSFFSEGSDGRAASATSK